MFFLVPPSVEKIYQHFRSGAVELRIKCESIILHVDDSYLTLRDVNTTWNSSVEKAQTHEKDTLQIRWHWSSDSPDQQTH